MKGAERSEPEPSPARERARTPFAAFGLFCCVKRRLERTLSNRRQPETKNFGRREGASAGQPGRGKQAEQNKATRQAVRWKDQLDRTVWTEGGVGVADSGDKLAEQDREDRSAQCRHNPLRSRPQSRINSTAIHHPRTWEKSAEQTEHRNSTQTITDHDHQSKL